MNRYTLSGPFVPLLNGLIIISVVFIFSPAAFYTDNTEISPFVRNYIFSFEEQESPLSSHLPSIRMKYNLESIQIGLLENFFVSEQKIFLKGTHGLAILDLDKKEASIKRIRSILIGLDDKQGIWYLTGKSNSIYRWDGNHTFEYQKEHGWSLPARLYNPFLPVSSTPLLIAGDHLWLATSKDVRLFDGIKWRIFSATEIGLKLPLKSGVGTSFTLAHNSLTGEIWTAACFWQGDQWLGGSPPYKFDGIRWERVASPFEDLCVTQLSFDKRGNVFLVTPNSIWKYEKNNWNELVLDNLHQQMEGLPITITQFSLDSFDNVWFSSQIAKKNGVPERYFLFKHDQAELLNVTSFQTISTPVFFITQDHSIIVLINKKVLSISPTRAELISPHSFDLITQDSHQHIWLISGIKDQPLLWSLD